MKMKNVIGAFFIGLMLLGTAAAYDTAIEVTLESGDFQDSETLEALGAGGQDWDDDRVKLRIIDSSGSGVETQTLVSGTGTWEVGNTANIGPISLTEGNLYGLRVLYNGITTDSNERGGQEGVIPCETTNDNFGDCGSNEAHWFVA